MLQRNPEHTVAVIFRQGINVQVPFSEVPVDRHLEGETHEQSALRIARDVGINATVSYLLTVPSTAEKDDRPDRLYLLNDNTSGITTWKSDFMVPVMDLPKVVNEHPRLTNTERELFYAVARHFEYRSL